MLAPRWGRALRFGSMARVRKLTPADGTEQPWRNGRGRTLEIARAGGADFDWRLAAAGVGEDGPFSDFAGYRRLLVVTAGAGLVLEFPPPSQRRERLRPLEPCAFDGAPAPHARLVGGPVEDLGLIWQPQRCRASMQGLRLGRRALRLELAPGELGFAHLLGAGLRARVSGEELPIDGAPRDTLVLEDARAGDELELRGLEDESCCVWTVVAPV